MTILFDFGILKGAAELSRVFGVMQSRCVILGVVEPASRSSFVLDRRTAVKIIFSFILCPSRRNLDLLFFVLSEYHFNWDVKLLCSHKLG